MVVADKRMDCHHRCDRNIKGKIRYKEKREQITVTIYKYLP